MFRFIRVATVMLLTNGVAGGQTTWHVDDDAPGDPGPGDPLVSDPLEDGSSARPFDAIREALDVALDGDEIVLADGTYTGLPNRRLEFAGKGVTLRSANGPEVCTIDLLETGQAILFQNGEDENTVVEGIAFVDGRGRTLGDRKVGGAIQCIAASPTIRNCHFRGNETESGGALHLNGSARILNCLFEGNRTTGFNAGNGGAIQVAAGDVLLADSRFVQNQSARFGGAVHGSNVTIERCEFQENRAFRGGGVYGADALILRESLIQENLAGYTAGDAEGGGVWAGGHSVIERCVIRNNEIATSGFGGGVHLSDDALLVDCLVEGNDGDATAGGVYARSGTIRRCRIIGNDAGGGGGFGTREFGNVRIEDSLFYQNTASSGGALLVQHGNAIVEVNNCTIVENVADTVSGGGVYVLDGEARFANAILWGNVAASGGDQASVFDATLEVRSSLVAGGQDAIRLNGDTEILWLDFNFDADPRFVDPAAGDFRIDPTSPAVNEGEPDQVEGIFDLDLAPRIQECRIDIGAYESAGFNDCDGNGVSDECELLAGTTTDCDANRRPDLCDTDPTDPDGNGQVAADCNGNRVPDACEPDCDTNGIPDACDVDPSDPDGDGIVQPDCDADGRPDVCDGDCNGNGIPDACDTDPSDPDGDGQVFPACDPRGIPDECQPDCNENGVPDPCDLDPNDPDGDGVIWEDCDANFIPDACEINTLRVDTRTRPRGATFGATLTMQGDRALVGDPDAGRAHLLQQSEGAWVFDETFSRAQDPGFGSGLALDGDRLAISAPQAFVAGVQRPVVWFYRLVDQEWTIESTLVPDQLEGVTPAARQLYLSDDLFVLTAPGLDGGCVIIYREVNGQWIEQVRLKSWGDASSDDRCGETLQVQGNLLVFGCPRENSLRGAVYAYRYGNGAWHPEFRVENANADPTDQFGGGLALHGDTLIVGAPTDRSGGANDAGAAFVFRYDGGNWNREVRLRLAVPRPFDNLGRTIGIEGDQLYLGVDVRGLVYPFTYDGTEWHEQLPIDAAQHDSDATVNVTALAYAGNQLLAGLNANRTPNNALLTVRYLTDCDGDQQLDHCNPGPDDNRNDRPDRCEPDCNGNGVPDELDVDPDDPDGDGLVYADCDSNLVPDICDLDPADPDGNGYSRNDCNGNGVLDSCESDCDGNGLADDCDIASGGDGNGDGLLDVCTMRGDLNADGRVDATDLAMVLNNFGCEPGCPGDANDDGRTNLIDLAIVLSGYGI